jgi:hypothetical protein
MLNPEYNPDLFKVNVKRRIFNKFAMTEEWNKLVNKWYYDIAINIEKVRISV